ncbi:MAG: hypothetical protein IPJ88_02090 [Myxococcales bacterium]|nr:MAG: hypothetical protein IPJ88_02090 [Myxococcales bacterium]
MKILLIYCCGLVALVACGSGSIGATHDSGTFDSELQFDGSDLSDSGLDGSSPPNPGPGDQMAEPTIPPGDIPAWMEPHGINVHDLVGNVPEAHLVDTIVSAFPGLGRYISGTRNGSTVTIRVRYSLREDASGQFSQGSAPGQLAALDQWPTVVPASELHLYNGTTEVTDKVIRYRCRAAGLVKPSDNAASLDRYPVTQVNTNLFNEAGALVLPANRGCTFLLNGLYPELIGESTFRSNNKIQVNVLGQQSFTFKSYIGVGNAGNLTPLQTQLSNTYASRHDKFDIAPPNGTDVVLLKFPPAPVDAYGPIANIARPSSGSYRFASTAGPGLSVDHITSIAMSPSLQWQDADQSGSTTELVFLPTLGPVNKISSPEYFVPFGVSYNPCMSSGGCSAGLLTQIYNATMTMTLYYYSIERTGDNLYKIPLRQVGVTYTSAAPGTVTTHGHGYFDYQGRLVDFEP